LPADWATADAIPVEFTTLIDGYSYAVLPPRPPDDAMPTMNMQNQIVTVPENWEVLSSSMGGFRDVIKSLGSHGWGTHLLVVKNGEVFDSYRTMLYTAGGQAGTRHRAGMRGLEAVSSTRDGEDGGCRTFRFKSSGGRLVIRNRSTCGGVDKSMFSSR